jgi:predicted xylose isomerase-like sugar epimerase
LALLKDAIQHVGAPREHLRPHSKLVRRERLRQVEVRNGGGSVVGVVGQSKRVVRLLAQVDVVGTTSRG